MKAIAFGLMVWCLSLSAGGAEKCRTKLADLAVLNEIAIKQGVLDDESWQISKSLMGDGSAQELKNLRRLGAIEAEQKDLMRQWHNVIYGAPLRCQPEGSFTAPSLEEGLVIQQLIDQL